MIRLREMLIGLLALLLAACHEPKAEQFTIEVLNGYTPIKDQGQSETCWAYAMLAAIETEHIMRGDSVNLSPAFAEVMIERNPQAPESKRGTGMTLLNLIQTHGLVPYDAMRTTEIPPPQWAFLYGVQYSLQEFARSVCKPGEYGALTTTNQHPYYQQVVLPLPDNWEHTFFFNLPADSLLHLTERAVREGHGVCWEGDISEHGFSFEKGVARLSLINGTTTDDHCMAIVGLAHDANGQAFFIMKNSWGTHNPYGGLLYMAADYFQQKTVAIFMPRIVYED